MSGQTKLHFNAFGPEVSSEFQENLFPLSSGKSAAPLPGSRMNSESETKDMGRAGVIFHFKMDGPPNESVEIRAKISDPIGVFMLSAQISGETRMSVEGVKGTLRHPKGNMTLFAGVDQIMRATVNTSSSFENISLLIPGDLILKTLEGEWAPRTLKKVLETGKFSKPILNRANTTYALRRTMTEMIANPYHGAVERIYLQGKLMELLAELATVDQEKRKTEFKPGDAHKSCVTEAIDILTMDPENPKTPLELSMMVGASYKTLNRGFIKQHGVSLYQYINAIALDHAKQILESTDISVAQLAFKYGYSSSSAFIRAFHRRFGHTPGSVRKRR